MACTLRMQLTHDCPGLYLHRTVIHLKTACKHAWSLSLTHVLEHHA